MGFNKRDSDGSVGSDSEGKHSPEQRRKKLVRARGSRQHASSDNLNNETELQESKSQSEDSDDDVDENNSFDKNDGQFDTSNGPKKEKVDVDVLVRRTFGNLRSARRNDGGNF
ncbi:Sytl5p [Sarracenia purpurea var. burkii]